MSLSTVLHVAVPVFMFVAVLYLQHSPSFSSAKSHELLHRMRGKGLSGSYKFTRGPCIYSTTMVAVEVTLVNNSEAPISNICVGEKV